MNLPLEKIGPILRKRRTEMGLRIHDLADEQISKSTISNAERGLPIVTEAMYEYLLKKLELTHTMQTMLEETEQQEQEAKEALLALESMISTDPEEALQKLQHIQHTYPIPKNTPLYALHTFLLGRCAFEQKKWEKAKKLFGEVAELAQQKGNLAYTNLYSACMNELGRIAYYEDQLKDALQYTTNGINQLEQEGERAHYLFHLLLNKGIYLEKVKEPEKALEAIEELDRKINQHSTVCDALYIVHLDIIIQMHNMYASIYNELQMYQKALEYAQKGVILAQKNKYFHLLLLLRTTLGIILCNLGKTQEAEKCYLAILNFRNRINVEHDFVFVYVELGDLYLKQKNWIEAEKIFNQAIEISKRHNDLIHVIECLIRLGDCFVEQKKFDQAIQYYQDAELNIKTSGNLQKESEIVTNLGYCYLNIGEQNKLQMYQQKALEINTKIRWGDN
ncbi:helix-turn-helix domain-containing protein [Shimazuella kribbensis]|uniref:helix-turn-helix domain-containing protein n=1 Tax=Shimazuella kribbensis TaxID=139808 RepID=UPI000404B154|nr:helix-turn-helix transcriptional regulator [Shimazuella kribbensis]